MMMQPAGVIVGGNSYGTANSEVSAAAALILLLLPPLLQTLLQLLVKNSMMEITLLLLLNDGGSAPVVSIEAIAVIKLQQLVFEVDIKCPVCLLYGQGIAHVQFTTKADVRRQLLLLLLLLWLEVKRCWSRRPQPLRSQAGGGGVWYWSCVVPWPRPWVVGDGQLSRAHDVRCDSGARAVAADAAAAAGTANALTAAADVHDTKAPTTRLSVVLQRPPHHVITPRGNTQTLQFCPYRGTPNVLHNDTALKLGHYTILN